MPITDIRPIKSQLREKYKQMRRDLTPDAKAEKDSKIAQRIYRLWQYRQNDTVLTYVSTAIEVDTHAIIEQALLDGKKVAVPRCVPDTRLMEFYYINGLDDLQPGSFGVLEPLPNPEKLVTDFSKGICLVPAFSYDWNGYRLGYGKGYYDRFLSRFGGDIIGVCYSECIRPSLPHGRYDRTVELLVTDRFLRKIRGERYGRKF